VRKAKKRCVEPQSSPIKLVFGDDIQMNEVVAMVSQTLVGRFFYHRISEKQLREWLSREWEVLISYGPWFFFLGRRWPRFIFFSEVYLDKILNKCWLWETTPLCLKCWMSVFDTRRERMESTPI